VRQTLAVILCTNREAARADWDVRRAYWAHFSDDRQETTFNEEVNRRCALPRLETQQERAGRIFAQELGRRFGPGLPVIPAQQPLTEQHVRCVIAAFHNRAAEIRARLTGDALVESNLSPEEHIEIQTALAQKGFLQNRNQKYGASADGQFGPNTRAAIKDFQRSIGSRPTGFLSSEQRVAVVESPEEREFRDEAKKRAEEQRQQDENERERKRLQDEAEKKQAEEQRKLDEAKAKQDEIDREAEEATKWRQRIDEAKQKGAEYAARATDVKWSLQERTDPMTDEQVYTVLSRQTNGTGALAVVEGVCSKNQVLFQATLQDDDDSKIPLGFARSSAGGIIGNKRINDDSSLATNFPLDKWNNRIVVSRQSFRQDDPESADTTWKVLAEIETSRGTLYIKIPTLDAKIQKLFAACKYRYEVEKRRQG
jgi:peptidoglycan hydrolase-like protein with peptidoglycan-binding domain